MKVAAVRKLLKRNEAVKYLYQSAMSTGGRGIPRSLGVPGLLSALHRLDVDYVVLRWFETLPHVARGQDIDLLVSDEHAPYLDELLTRSPVRSGVACDVYSVHGLATFTHGGLAYYPPALAERILARAIRHQASGARVPCKEDHFYSLAYHAIYKKGYKSGLPVSSREGPRNAAPKHDYETVLRNLAFELGLDVSITMQDLDKHLDDAGWRPSFDTLAKWRKGNPFCAEIHDRLLDADDAPPGLVVLVVRERSNQPEAIAEIARLTRAQGLIEVAIHELRADQVEIASRKIRGGNWGPGPYATSGGAPHTILVYVDPAPSPPTPDEVARHPGIDNGRIRLLKQTVRAWWNEDRPEDERCNILHTSDSAAHAAHYLQTMLPESAESILGLATAASHRREAPA